jgi:D-psicose/D-tagatose/L-ribulose 3-epimerase
MTFGINTFLLTSPFTDKSLPLLKKFSSWGFDSVEVALEEVNHVNPVLLKNALRENKIVCKSMCAITGPGRDLRGSKQEQETAIDYIKGAIDLTAEVGASVLMGPMYSSVGRAESTDENERKRQWELVTGHLKNLAEYAGACNVKLALEPLNRYETDFINTCQQAMDLIDDIGHNAMCILLDTYHMNIEEKDSAQAILLAGDRLGHFHACGCDRGTPGNDHINWDTIVAALKQIGYDESIVIESFTTDVKVIAKAASIWRKFEPSQEDIAIEGLKFLKSRFNKD